MLHDINEVEEVPVTHVSVCIWVIYPKVMCNNEGLVIIL